MSKSYRGPSIDASCNILLYLAKWFQGRRFFLEIDQLETRIAYICMAAMSVNGPGRNEQSLVRTFHDATCAFSRGCCEVNGTVVNTVCGGLKKI